MKEDFNSFNILDLDPAEIVFCAITGAKVGTGNQYRVMAPMSLDLRKMLQVCKKKDKSLLPEKKSKSLPTTYAMVNISFPDKWKRQIHLLFKLKVPEKIDVNDKKLAKKYKAFALDYYLFRSEHAKVQEYNFEIKDPITQKRLSPDFEKQMNDRNKELREEEPEKKDSQKSGKESEENQGGEKTEKEPIQEKSNPYLDLLKKEVWKKFSNLLKYYLSNYDRDNIVCAMRGFLYEKGVDLEFSDKKSRHYVIYKRSASKAKEGSCLFIEDTLYDEMMNWTWLGKTPELNKDCDLTAVRAYEALVQSAIVGVVEIDPKNILLLDSVTSKEPVPGNRLIVIKKDETVEAVTEEVYEERFHKRYENRNIIWDGQALVDESVFEAAGFTGENRHGMMLLRNSFFKACAFNVKIRKFYEKNHVTVVKDMFGEEHNAKDIKMIVTIDSLKYAKFTDLFFTGKNAKKLMYNYWKKKIDKTFGIVKVEHASNLGNGKYHEVSYQVLNTLPFTDEEIKELVEEDFHYLKLISDYDDLSGMLYHLKNATKSIRKRYFYYYMCKYNPQIVNTREYRKFLKDDIQDYYYERMSRGKLKLKGDFYTICSMPLEMLMYSVDQDIEKISPYLGKSEVYLKGMEEGKELPIFRFPHLTEGGVCLMKSKACADYDEYLNFENDTGTNILVLSPWESNIMVRLGGADFDSDTVLGIQENAVVSAVKRLQEFKWLNPRPDDGPMVAEAGDGLKEGARKYPYGPKGMAELDNELAKSNIGSISNRAQLLISYLWDGCNNDMDAENLSKIYEKILILSVMNELEIDRSKHVISIDPDKVKKEMVEELQKITYANNKRACLKKMEKEEKDGKNDFIYPVFFFKGNKAYWDCPVDKIGKLVNDSKIKNTKIGKAIKMKKLFSLERDQGSSTGERSNSEQLNNIREKIKKAWDSIGKYGQYRDKNEIGQPSEQELEAVEEISNLKITPATMRTLFNYAFSSGKEEYKVFSDNCFRYLGLLMMIGEKIEEKNKEKDEKDRKINPVWEIIRDKSIDPLMDPEPISEDKVESGKKCITIWGETYLTGHQNEKAKQNRNADAQNE